MMVMALQVLGGHGHDKIIKDPEGFGKVSALYRADATRELITQHCVSHRTQVLG
jgi:hypothetical protein